MDPNTILIRCSAIGKIMTEPKLKTDKEAGRLGETAKSYLEDLYKSIKYSREQEYSSKYIEKGIKGEEDAITLLTLQKKMFFKKNEIRLNNEFLTGEPDIYIGEDINNAEEGFDTKCSWDLFTFPMFDQVLKTEYYWQNHGYMALTGAKKWSTAYCLINGTPEAIMSEKKKVYYSMDCPGDENEEYKRKCIEIEKNMIFDMQLFKKQYPGFDLDVKDWNYDIPRDERLKIFSVERDEEVIKRIYAQVEKCRKHIADTFVDLKKAA